MMFCQGDEAYCSNNIGKDKKDDEKANKFGEGVVDGKVTSKSCFMPEPVTAAQ